MIKYRVLDYKFKRQRKKINQKLLTFKITSSILKLSNTAVTQIYISLFPLFYYNLLNFLYQTWYIFILRNMFRPGMHLWGLIIFFMKHIEWQMMNGIMLGKYV